LNENELVLCPDLMSKTKLKDLSSKEDVKLLPI